MKQRVSDIMEEHVIQVSPDDPLVSVARLFFDDQISGAPVVSESGSVIGIVSLTDIVRSAGDESPKALSESSYYRQLRAVRPAWLEEPHNVNDRVSALCVSDVMTEEVVSVRSDSKISALAKLVRENHIHRVLVIDDTDLGEKLVGIVSLFDLVGLLEEARD